ncbi:hypothetical protein CcCBS67573_g02698 [Chytriomyces confervae]|uniref:Hemerythrin-like domain-containing protein n=1 Tax=Chytriomyces confervae TaxID=246404 RepID=A0A507FI03_9FUNG|nr:hypothetical protein HDU80_008753 [Chytriomyces hyalinus]TPX76039.1 hypothetical protein CcCBS67573_g02698 [Chytriomyces confervae]
MADSFAFNESVIRTVHNVIKRSLVQCIHNCNAAAVPSKKALKSFLGYVDAAMDMLHHHHTNEDDVYFPVLRKSGLTTESLSAEHEQLHPLIADVTHVVQVYRRAQEFKTVSQDTFDFASLKSKLEEIQRILVPHLDKEEEEHTAQVLRDAGIKASDLNDVHNKISKAEQARDPTMALPFLYLHLTAEEKISFWKAVMPFFVRFILLPIVTFAHRDYWAFSYAKAPVA